MIAGRAIAAIALCGAALSCAGVPIASGEPRARVALRCPDPDAEVAVDGVPRGRASDFTGGAGRQLLLPAGAHRIVVRSAGGASAVRELSVGPEDALTVAVDLPPGREARRESLGAAKAYELVRGGSP